MSVSHLESLVEKGMHHQAWTEFGRLINDGHLTTGELATAHLLIAISRYQIGQCYSAVNLADLAKDYAVKAGDTVLLGRVWGNLAEMYRAVGDMAEAQTYCIKWFENLTMYPELTNWRGRMTYTQALIKRARRDHGYLHAFREAVAYFRQERQEAPEREKVKLGSRLVMALQMAARTCYEIGALAEGDGYCSEAHDIIYEINDSTEAVKEQMALCMCRDYHAGDYEGVIRLAPEFLIDGPKSTLDQQFWACWYLAMIYSKSEATLPNARAIATTVYDLAINLRLPHYLNKYSELQALIKPGRRAV